MSHQRYPSHDPVKEPHSISLKVLRLSRPSLVTQYPVEPPLSSPASKPSPIQGSLAYQSKADTNPSPFLLSPILNLPVSFGSAYVGQTFSCTLCANNDLADDAGRRIRDVRIDAEMKTPGLGAVQKLELMPAADPFGKSTGNDGARDLDMGETMQKVVTFDLKEEGNHVLAVTVSYYEATETSGRTRTFRKLYQFICKASLIVRTKVGELEVRSAKEDDTSAETAEEPSKASESTRKKSRRRRRKRWMLEAQLENCSEDVIQLEKVVMDLEQGFAYRDCNWEASGSAKPVLHPSEVEQVCFIVEDTTGDSEAEGPRPGVKPTTDGRVVFGVLGIGWRGEMGNRGFLSTGKLGIRQAR